MGNRRIGHVQANLSHGLAEQVAVFGFVDRVACRANHFDAVFLQHTFPNQVQCTV